MTGSDYFISCARVSGNLGAKLDSCTLLNFCFLSVYGGLAHSFSNPTSIEYFLYSINLGINSIGGLLNTRNANSSRIV